MDVIEYMQYIAREYKLKYLCYTYHGCTGYRLTKNPDNYVEIYLRDNGTFGLLDRIGTSGSGGFDGTIKNVESSLKRMGVLSEIEQITIF